MSDLSVLSHEYTTASELSRLINSALIVLKKTCLGLSGAKTITPDQVDNSRRCLAEVLDTIIGLMDARRVHQLDPMAIARVPGALVTRLQAERRGDLAYYLEDLEQVAARLREDPSKLTDGDLASLDQLAAAAAAETSSVFRRLMRL